MVLVGALVQVLLVPPLGIVASGDGLVAVPLRVECLLRTVSPPHYDSWQQRPWPCVGIFPSTPCFLCCWGAVCSLTEVFIIV